MVSTDTPVASAPDIRPARPRNPVVDVFVRLYRDKPMAFWGGLAPIVLVILVAVLAGAITRVPPNLQNSAVVLEGPSLSHPFGTDQFGRDVYSRVVYGARLSLEVGLIPVFVGITIATVIGVISGYFGGLVDLVIQRGVDILMGFPSFILLLLLAAILTPSKTSTIIGISVILIAGPVRVIRGQVLAIKEHTFVEAARVLGASETRMMLRHILPNILDLVIVILSINVSFAIIAAASLSFLGLGVPPPTPDWGGMVSGTELAYLSTAPWIMIAAGGALTITVFGFNMLGDGLRDVLDPRLRGS